MSGPNGDLIISAESSEVALVPTPAGMAKATDVYEVPSGSFVHGASPNTMEIYGPDGQLILTVVDETQQDDSGTVETVPSYSNWIEDGWWGYGSYGSFYAEWTVPAAPQNSWIDDDVVYLFNGVEGPGANAYSGKEVILQPVLEFNQDGWLPGNPLLGRVWVVNSDNQYVRSGTIGVAVGDVMAGAISLIDPTQPVWAASISDQTTGSYAALTTDRLGTTSQFVTVALEGHNLETDPDLFGTTNFVNLEVRDQNGGLLNPSWNARIWPGASDYFSNLGVIVFGSSAVRLRTNRVPSGGGCPFLQTWDGVQYVDEGLLSIHNEAGTDVIYEHTLTTVPERVNGAYKFRLIEHPQTISYIDQVQLRVILGDGTVRELPLRKAWHSEDGNVLDLLLRSDDRKAEERGANYNGGTSQSTDLEFAALGTETDAVAFVFTIEGINPDPYSKLP